MRLFFVRIRGFFLFSGLAACLSSPVQAEKIPELPQSLTPEQRVMAYHIKAVFADEPLMLKVARCESGLVHRENGELIQNRAGSSARGVFQVLMRVHLPEMKRMRLNPERTDHYLAYVRHLYDTYGLSPWRESQHCWGKSRSTPRG